MAASTTGPSWGNILDVGSKIATPVIGVCLWLYINNIVQTNLKPIQQEIRGFTTLQQVILSRLETAERNIEGLDSRIEDVKGEIADRTTGRFTKDDAKTLQEQWKNYWQTLSSQFERRLEKIEDEVGEMRKQCKE